MLDGVAGLMETQTDNTGASGANKRSYVQHA
jgi:hypothetical protein